MRIFGKPVFVTDACAVLGQPGDTAFILPDSLPSAAQIRSLLSLPAGDSTSARLDVTAAQFGIEAAQRDVRRANAAYIPRLNGFGRFDWNSPDQLFGIAPPTPSSASTRSTESATSSSMLCGR